jgi:hypothetical protein
MAGMTRRTLEAPAVGGRPLEGESRRDFNCRMRREKQVRAVALAQAEGHAASRACACAGCRVFFAVEAATFSRKMAPRRARGQPVVEEARETFYRGRT